MLVGIRLEAKGRLTKRLTASRAVYKIRYKGIFKKYIFFLYKTINNYY